MSLPRTVKLLKLGSGFRKERNGLVIMDIGDSVPSAEAGYEIGAIFIHTDGSAGTMFYVNEGTTSSCTFAASSPLTGTQETALNSITGTALDLGTSLTTRAIDIETTSASVNAGTSVRPVYMQHTATGAGSVGHRAEFHTQATAKLGGWANALKGYFEFGASGDITGLASGICAEVKMPNAAISGTMTVLELELVDQASTGYGSGGSLIRANVTGTVTAFDSNGFLFDLQGTTPAAGKFILLDGDEPADYNEKTVYIKCRHGATTFYLLGCTEQTVD